jgi:6-phosphogluconolactonase
LLEDKQDIPKLDLVWLGMGEDGHTLSLFPGQEFLDESSELVLPIHNSPKPPPDRISLSLKALKNVTQCFILAQGAGKAEVVARALKQDLSLPIARAIKTIESGGGKVNWIIDKAASTSQDL